jgi:hypothetical protein
MASADRLEGLYHIVNRVDMTWDLAKEVYDTTNSEVSSIPWTSDNAKSDWELLKTWVTAATGDNRTNPGFEHLNNVKEATKNILRRLLGRRQGLSADELAPEPARDMFLDAFSRSFGFGLGGGKPTSQKAKFCRCIKDVRKTIRPRKGSTAEQAAIGVCVKSVLHRRGRTIKKFSCKKKGRLVTQKRK